MNKLKGARALLAYATQVLEQAKSVSESGEQLLNTNNKEDKQDILELLLFECDDVLEWCERVVKTINVIKKEVALLEEELK
jgi:hypothetical protein